MITSTEARKIIIEGARDLFPRILPSRLQEARSALLSHLNMDLKDFGFFPSGGAKFENYCSQVVKSLKESGEMTTNGWTWEWLSEPLPCTPPPVMMSMFDLFEGDVVEEVEAPSLYNLGCEETMIRLIAITPCYGKMVSTDPVCIGCPLFSLCGEKKGEESKHKREARQARNEALEGARQAGYDLKNVKVPKSARIHESYSITALNNTHCIVSGGVINKGEDAIVIPSWGIVKPIVGEAFKAIS